MTSKVSKQDKLKYGVNVIKACLKSLSSNPGVYRMLDDQGKVLAATGEPGKKLGEFGEAHYMTLAPGDVIYVADTIKPDLHKFIENPIHSKAYKKR